MGALIVKITRAVVHRVIVDHHPVARITQFPRDVGVAELFRKINVDELRDVGIV